ncbi:hypothetical protein CY35_08G064700 [Sphagnum magellanicum]|nr:hypothetical protein CY35_08G064700 [Sphagnum magellanicum]
MATVFSDQLDGQEEQHATYRQSVVDYVQEHREEFEPFVEDEVPFEEYCSTMREDGTWAGNMELQATSLVTGCNICIHQLKTPRWHIRNFESADACTLHLSYHDGEHYNSVRRLDDDGGGRAKPITIEVDARPSTKPPPAKDKMNHGHQIVKIVMDGTGCKSVDRVQEVLHDVHGDTDAAIEFLIAEQASGGDVSPACSCERIPHSPEGSGIYFPPSCKVKLTTTGHVEYTVMILSHQHHKILALSLKLKKGLPLMQLVRPTVPPCHFRERLGTRHAHVALNVSTSLVVVLNIQSLPSLPYQGQMKSSQTGSGSRG